MLMSVLVKYLVYTTDSDKARAKLVPRHKKTAEELVETMDCRKQRETKKEQWSHPLLSEEVFKGPKVAVTLTEKLPSVNCQLN